jgi:hypothetical protein
MIHKKVVLSILIIAFIGMAAASTWANFDVTATDSGNTLKAGKIEINLYETTSFPFTITHMVPDSTTDKILFHQLVWPQTGQYAVTVQNTGDIPASLFLSDVLASADSATLPNNVAIYYSTDATSASPTKLTSTPTDTKINIPVGGNQVMFFWYSYANVANQNAEMGKTASATINFELKNPDTSTPGSGI